MMKAFLGYIAYCGGLLAFSFAYAHSNMGGWPLVWLFIALIGFGVWISWGAESRYRDKISKEISALIIGGSSHMNLRDLRDHLKEKKLL